MSQKESVISSLTSFGHEDLCGFASYLGIEYEDLMKIQEQNAKFKDNI